MPWRQTKPMNERAHFAFACESELYSMTELCRQYGISRKTGYKWLARYRQEGVSGLAEHSRAPQTCPHRMPLDVETALREERGNHPHWGPRKLLARLAVNQPELAERLPAASTVGDLLKRVGLVEARKRRSRPVHSGASPLKQVATAPNDVWSVDFKGEFRTQDSCLCYPLTVSDALSRYLLACDGLSSTAYEGTQSAFEQLFGRVGLPLAIRSDNGAPFCSQAIGGLSRLSVWWMKLGIVHQRIKPGKPQQNGRHERMHRTLKAETARPPAEDHKRQQERFDAFRKEYNELRPHEALGMKTPAAIWTPPTRSLPASLPEPVYSGHMEIRSVRHNGEIKFLGQRLFLSETLAHERVALEEVEDGVWSLFFYNNLLARLDQRNMRFVSAGTVAPAEPDKPAA